MNSCRRIILAGGTGFIGRFLAEWLQGRGYEVVVLTRSPKRSTIPIQYVEWDGRTAGEWCQRLDGALAVVNLAGRSVNCRYHARHRREIMDSRVDSTRAIAAAIQQCSRPPAVWLNSSTATIYKHSLDRLMTEDGEIGDTPEAKDKFSIEVACAWERAFDEAVTPATRKVAMRSAMVFATGEGGVYRVLRRLAGCGLGGKMGSGRQFVSWIHADDFCRAVEWLIARDEFNGPVNVAAPQPIPNDEVMRLFRSARGMTFGLPASRWMLELGAIFLRTETELIIKSRRVVPKRLLDSGFQFRFAGMCEAIRDLEIRLAPESIRA